MLGGEEEAVCDVIVNGRLLEHVSGFEIDESFTVGAECRRKVASRRRVGGVFRSLVNARSLNLSV